MRGHAHLLVCFQVSDISHTIGKPRAALRRGPPDMPEWTLHERIPSHCRMPSHSTRLLWLRRRKSEQRGPVPRRVPAVASQGVACQTCSWAATATLAYRPTRATLPCLRTTARHCRESVMTYYPAFRSGRRCGIEHGRALSQPATQRCFWDCWSRKPASNWHPAVCTCTLWKDMQDCCGHWQRRAPQSAQQRLTEAPLPRAQWPWER